MDIFIVLIHCRQGRSKWAARFASVRLNSRAPWEQKRQIVGMVKSPVEGNSIVILKMDKPVIFSGKYISFFVISLKFILLFEFLESLCFFLFMN